MILKIEKIVSLSCIMPKKELRKAASSSVKILASGEVREKEKKQ